MQIPNRREISLIRKNNCRIADENSVFKIPVFCRRGPVVTAGEQDLAIKNRILVVHDSRADSFSSLQMKSRSFQSRDDRTRASSLFGVGNNSHRHSAIARGD